MPGEPDALSQSLQANKKCFWLHKRYRVHISCLFIPTVANRVRIICWGIHFTEFRNTSLHHTPFRGLVFVFFFNTSVRDLLHPSNSFIDKILLSAWNLESKTDKASAFKKQQFTVRAVGMKARSSWCFQNRFKRQKNTVTIDSSKTCGCPLSSATKL